MLRTFLAALLLCLVTTSLTAADDGLYELRIYTCEPGKLDALNTRFRDHTLRLFEKHGMKNIAYWTPVENTDEKSKLIYILKHQNREQATAAWKAFQNDPEWQAVAKASREKHGKILAERPESIYMSTTDYSPALHPAQKSKLYELRIYVTEPNRLDSLNARFRNHTVKIFDRHGIHSLAYWLPTDKPASENKLIYILEHDNPNSAKAGWNGFRTDEEWRKARAESEKDGKILAESPVSIYMTPTDFSPAK